MPPKKSERDNLYFEAALDQEINNLIKLVGLFDDGNHSIINIIANRLRVLLHDKGRNISLLSHCRIKEKVRFVDTAELRPFLRVDDYEAGYVGIAPLVTFGKTPYVHAALLDSSLRQEFKPFELWWNSIVIGLSNAEIELSRKDLVLDLSDKDGGSHYDKELREAYFAAVSGSMGGFMRVTGKEFSYPQRELVNFSLRQIAHEVLRSLAPNYPKKIVPEELVGQYSSWMIVNITKD